jgi:hypothetical protein
MAWLGRFGLHLAAALGATGIFVAAAAVGASQTRQTTEIVVPAPSPVARTPGARAAATANAVRPERSIAGRVLEAPSDVLVIQSLRGQEWRVTAAPGALIRLNGKAARLENLQVGDAVVILGQAQARGGFLAHAITARRR